MTERLGLGEQDAAEPQPAGGDLGARVPKGAVPALRRTAAHSGRAWPRVGQRVTPRTEGVGTHGAGPLGLGPLGTRTRSRRLKLSGRASLPAPDTS